MIASDKFGFFSALKDLQAVYGKTIDDARTEGWWRALQDLPLDAVRHGMTEAAKSERYFPAPAIVRGHALTHRAETARAAVRDVNLDTGECYCPTCEDTGWQLVTQYAPIYERDISVARVCACRPTNPVYRAANVSQPAFARRDA